MRSRNTTLLLLSCVPTFLARKKKKKIEGNSRVVGKKTKKAKKSGKKASVSSASSKTNKGKDGLVVNVSLLPPNVHRKSVDLKDQKYSIDAEDAGKIMMVRNFTLTEIDDAYAQQDLATNCWEDGEADEAYDAVKANLERLQAEELDRFRQFVLSIYSELHESRHFGQEQLFYQMAVKTPGMHPIVNYLTLQAHCRNKPIHISLGAQQLGGGVEVLKDDYGHEVPPALNAAVSASQKKRSTERKNLFAIVRCWFCTIRSQVLCTMASMPSINRSFTLCSYRMIKT